MKTGILGGTFDPIHTGHLNIAKKIIADLSLDRIIFIPNGNPPHKERIMASQNERQNMVKYAVSGCDKFEVDSMEMFKIGNLYTYKTLEQLKEKYPQDKLYFICGADNITEISRWKNPQRIFELSALIFINRPGYKIDENALNSLKENYNAEIYVCSGNDKDVSSTMIKKLVSENVNAEKYIPEKAREYFKTVYYNV